MKQLLATTAILAFSAGFASAEVTVSGSARMGIIDDFGTTGAQFTSRVRINFTASGETDSGLSFGASVRNDQSGVGNEANGDSTVFVSGAFGKLSMGDVDGAAAASMGQTDGVGFTGLSDLNEIAFLATGGSDVILFDAVFAGNEAITADTSVLYEYSTGDLSIYASLTQLNHTLPVSGYDADSAQSIAAAYTMGNYKFALGYERLEITSGATVWDIDQISLGADATLGAVVLKARFATGNVDGNNGFEQDNDQWSVSGTYSMDGLSVTAFVSDQEFTQSGTIASEREAYGLGASYDLGGGASVAGGYVKNQTTDEDAVDLGLNFSF